MQSSHATYIKRFSRLCFATFLFLSHWNVLKYASIPVRRNAFCCSIKKCSVNYGNYQIECHEGKFLSPLFCSLYFVNFMIWTTVWELMKIYWLWKWIMLVEIFLCVWKNLAVCNVEELWVIFYSKQVVILECDRHGWNLLYCICVARGSNI